MNGLQNLSDPIGIQPGDPCNAGNSAIRARRRAARALVVAADQQLAEAASITGDIDLCRASAKVQDWLAREPIDEEGGAPGEGQPGSEAAHGEAPEDGRTVDAQ